jgi:hypothetical protein
MTAMVAQSSLLSASTHACVKVSPIQFDELDKTDKVHHIRKIRQTIHRSVSFVKRSLSRSNSISSSLHSGSSHSIVSFDEDSTTRTRDESSSEPDDVKPLRSCLKQQTNHPNGFLPRRPKMVRFKRRSKYDVYMIEPYFSYASDLWYTTTDEKALFLSPQLESTTATIKAEQYMIAYTCAKKQVYPNEWFTMQPPQALIPSSSSSSSSSSSARYSKMLTTSYREISLGRQEYGFAGLEQYSVQLKKRRMMHVRSTVSMICAVYHELNRMDINTLLAMTNNPKLDWYPIDVLKYDEISKFVRQYAKSITEADRYWATAMGQADYDAAKQVYQDSDDDMKDDCSNVLRRTETMSATIVPKFIKSNNYVTTVQ